MSIIQDKLAELRYIKRKNLHEEAKLIGNYYRDIIRSFGVDCRYYKYKTSYPKEFTDNVSQNNLILNAYGYEPDPDFSISANMITYMEVENDIFNLNKYGVIPDMTVNFYFDSKDFAAALATKLGRLKEYPINEQSISATFTSADIENQDLILSSTFDSDILSGIYQIDFNDISFGLSAEPKDNILSCSVLSQSDAKWFFPVNDDIYKSFYYIVYENAKEMVSLHCSFDILDENGESVIPNDGCDWNYIKESIQDNQYMFLGNLYGTVLFHDIEAISKYKESIVPNVGDVVTIDFPDEHSREQYQITESTDKNLSRDGQNPLLHKYFWKCKAKRFVDNKYENFPETNYANKQLDEKLDIINQGAENVGEKVEAYLSAPIDQDWFYGGYGKSTNFHDITSVTSADISAYFVPANNQDENNPEEDEQNNAEITIIKFGNGTKLLTDGFDLFFKELDGTIHKIFYYGETPGYLENTPDVLRFLKATDDKIVFVDITGVTHDLTSGIAEEPTKDELKLYLDSMTKISTYSYGAENPNIVRNNFYKFTNCNSIIFATDKKTGFQTRKRRKNRQFYVFREFLKLMV